jgi:hypothetical protein
MPSGNPIVTIPPWARTMSVPVWVSAPDRSIHYLNERARSLFGLEGNRGLGEPCWLAVRARRACAGGRREPFCGPQCPIQCALRGRGRLKPVAVRIDDAQGRERRLRVLVFPLPSLQDEPPYLVHCAYPSYMSRGIENYLAARAEAFASPFSSRVDDSPSIEHHGILLPPGLL